MWNDIPNNIRNVESAALFKKQVRNYFLGQIDNEDPLKHDLLEEQYDSMYIYPLCLFLLFYYDWYIYISYFILFKEGGPSAEAVFQGALR